MRQTDPATSLLLEDDDSRTSNPLFSITELRSKGESRRFLDDLGYLLEGLSVTSSIGVRRSSALEVVTKMCDPEFLKKTKAADFIGRAWDLIFKARGDSFDNVRALLYLP